MFLRMLAKYFLPPPPKKKPSSGLISITGLQLIIQEISYKVYHKYMLKTYDLYVCKKYLNKTLSLSTYFI